MKSSVCRFVSVLFVFAFTLAVPLGGAAAKANVPLRTMYPAPTNTHWTPLTATQVAQLQAHQRFNNKVIVIMKDQAMNMAGKAHGQLVARGSILRAEQRPIVNELRQVRALHVKAFSLINAVSATVTKSELGYLRAQPGVRAVVPDKRLYLPRPAQAPVRTFTKQEKAAAKARARKATCTSSNPVLEPEALGQIKAQFQNPATPGQAASMATGAGVTVAFMADGVAYDDPDFIRPNGSDVFTDVEDFSGSGGIFAGGNTEGMLDASSIGAQGNERYPIGQYTNFEDPAFNNASQCPWIKVVGDAPGANLMDLQVFGFYTTTTSFVQAIQYAVSHGANVINQSFGSNPYPDQDVDPTALADEAAIAAGVVIVASSGDSGVNGSQGTPSTVPGVIAAGASTSFQIYKQLGDGGFQLGTGGYVDNGVSSLSSAGPSQAGTKGVDILAPGDLNWSLADPSAGVTDENGLPTGVVEEGGTSESAPLTSGVAALVIQKYRQTHSGASPSPAVVKAIITSSATDLHLPSQIQGAGLLNAFKAVEIAASWGNPVSKHVGMTLAVNSNGCLTAADFACNTAISAAGQPGTAENFNFSVTNTGTSTERVTPKSRTLAITRNRHGSVTLNPGTDPNFIDPAGFQRGYTETTTDVAAGTKVLDASIAWQNGDDPATTVRLEMLNPDGAYACFSQPQGSGNGFGRCVVNAPMPGTWKLIIWTRGVAGIGYAGKVNWSAISEKYVSYGPVTPNRAFIAPNGTTNFTYHATIPLTSGDGTSDIIVVGKKGRWVNEMTIPVIMRSMIATSSANGGAFSGVLTGGNARPDSSNDQVYQFNVPSGQNDLSLGLTLNGGSTDTNVEAILTNPNGVPVDTQSNATDIDESADPDAYVPTLQFFRRAPDPGNWTLTVLVNFYSGPITSQAFDGTIAFNTLNVTSANVPDSPATFLPADVPHAASITVTNTGNTEETYYVDPRLNTTTQYPIGGADNGGFPVNEFGFYVPPATTRLSVLAVNDTDSTPINLETVDQVGTSPSGFLGNPDLYSSNGTASEDIEYTPAEVPFGFWVGLADDINCQASLECDTGTAAENDDIVGEAFATTQTFDTSVTSDTGDFWTNLDGSNPNFEYTPLDLMPGDTGTINVTFTPDQAQGSEVSGHLYLDTLQTAGDFFTTTSGDEVASIPYDYKVEEGCAVSNSHQSNC